MSSFLEVSDCRSEMTLKGLGVRSLVLPTKKVQDHSSPDLLRKNLLLAPRLLQEPQDGTPQTRRACPLGSWACQLPSVGPPLLLVSSFQDTNLACHSFAATPFPAPHHMSQWPNCSVPLSPRPSRLCSTPHGEDCGLPPTAPGASFGVSPHGGDSQALFACACKALFIWGHPNTASLCGCLLYTLNPAYECMWRKGAMTVGWLLCHLCQRMRPRDRNSCPGHSSH